MKLRDHPLLSYRGVSSWPPVWISKLWMTCGEQQFPSNTAIKLCVANVLRILLLKGRSNYCDERGFRRTWLIKEP